MRRLFQPTLMLGLLLAACSAWCDTTLVTGTLADPNSVFTQTLSLTSTSDVTLQTLSFGGGVSLTGAVVPGSTANQPGGFAPDLALFDSSGLLLAFTAGVRSACPPATADAFFGGQCGDATLALAMLAPGDYTFALMALGVTPGATLGAGFTGTGSFLGAQAEFRTGNFAVDVTVSPEITGVPEPSTTSLFALGLSALAARRFRK